MKYVKSVVVLLCLAGFSQGVIWHVPGNFGTIQEAFNDDRVQSGDTIQVHSGTYYENINFIGKNVLLHGGDDINIPDPDNVIIDAGFQGTGVKFVNGEGPDAILRGSVASPLSVHLN